MVKYKQETKQNKNKTKQNKTKQNKTKQNKTKQKQNKTKQNKTKQNTKQNKTKQNKTKQNKTKQNKTKQNKNKKQNKTKQNKTKQNKNKTKYIQPGNPSSVGGAQFRLRWLEFFGCDVLVDSRFELVFVWDVGDIGWGEFQSMRVFGRNECFRQSASADWWEAVWCLQFEKCGIS